MKLIGQIEKGRLQGDCKGFGKGECMKKGRMRVATSGNLHFGGENACILPCAREIARILPLRWGFCGGECAQSPAKSLAAGPCAVYTSTFFFTLQNSYLLMSFNHSSNMIYLKLDMGKEEDLKCDVLDRLIGEIPVTRIGHVSTLNP